MKAGTYAYALQNNRVQMAMCQIFLRFIQIIKLERVS